MFSVEYLQKVMGAIMGAFIAIPSIAFGFYVTYLCVTALGN